ncbi:MAG: VOC family protein [Chitinophagaceae bacterium]|nr:MAG: VOC family protein [Chitinophagaceae bacterium]
MSTHALNWVEIPVLDFDRAKTFFSRIFDYEMPESTMGDQRLGFLLYDMQSRGVGGAIVKGEGYEPSLKGPKVYLNGGSDLNNVLNRVEAAGGKIVMPKTQITPQLGYFAVFTDTEGNELSLHSMG